MKHRSGTKYEDLAFVDSGTGKMLINMDYSKGNAAEMNKPMKAMLEQAKPYTVIGIHNHPGSSTPSISDISVCINRKYKCGVVVCHDGKIYKYSSNGQKYNESLAYLALANLERDGYNRSVKSIFTDAGIDIEAL